VLTYSNVAWAWQNNWTDHVPVLKYTFPEWFPGLAISQPFDFTGVNNAVRWGYQLMLGPGNYMIADSMAYPPWRQLSKYIQEILRILESVKGTICFGEFLDTQLVQFEGSKEMRYSMFRNPKTGKRACVVVNHGESPKEASVITFGGNSHGEVILHQPFKTPRNTRFPVKVVVPSERLAILEEV
jgi:hypothetical protein